ncbi:MAG: alpha/beta hydrolase [SAR202 cluster bacterium]|nr:alpha/beta hydrolase [SAR202 cluster bacterium]
MGLPRRVDLRGHGVNPPLDLSHTTMTDYAGDVRGFVAGLRAQPIVIGWSMSGLVAVMVASTGDAGACVALEPSPPANRIYETIKLGSGMFDSTEYGIKTADPQTQPSMPDLDLAERRIALSSLEPESRMARDEHKRGITIEPLTCTLLLITSSGGANKIEEYDQHLPGGERYAAEGASHWGFLLNGRSVTKTVPAVLQWLEDSGVTGQ